MATRLQIRLTDGLSRPIPLGEDPVTIGRHPDNFVRIKDNSSSRHHAVIEPDGEGNFILRDLGSANGTKVNNALVTTYTLESGDEISIGRFTFAVEPRRVRGILNSSKSAAGANRSESDEDQSSIDRGADFDGPWAAELDQVIRGLGDDVERAFEAVRLVDAGGDATGVLDGDGPGPVATRLLLQAASRSRATDIHLEPKTESCHVRLRVDGQMVWLVELPRKVGELLTGLVKGACRMSSAAKDAVQDGHFSVRFPDRRVEYRASLTPSVHGQKLVLRVLDQRGVPTALDDLGLSAHVLDRIRRVCALDAGMFLVCGPTGSGKTTTLYNGLREIDREARNVVTIEDPVEYQITGVTQMPIDERRGHTFATLLRSVLRQDPDVILLGEIRDEDTARAAMQAAMTGHLVFTTVHAKDTISAIFRLMDLKVEPYLVANSLSLVLAQRLVRRLCPNCKSPVTPDSGMITTLGKFLKGDRKVYIPVGCPRCLDTGFRGRRALFELLDVDDDLRDIILDRPSIQGMRQSISRGVFHSLAEFGYRLVGEGVVPYAELERVVE